MSEISDGRIPALKWAIDLVRAAAPEGPEWQILDDILHEEKVKRHLALQESLGHHGPKARDR